MIGNIKQRVKLSDYRGKQNVVLVFYPADWTPVCSAELPAFNAELEKFEGYQRRVIGISVDSIPSHIAWQKKEIGILSLPLASDFYPHGEIAAKYGILRESEPVPGISERAVFVVDKKGKIAYAKVAPHRPAAGNGRSVCGAAEAVRNSCEFPSYSRERRTGSRSDKPPKSEGGHVPPVLASLSVSHSGLVV